MCLMYFYTYLYSALYIYFDSSQSFSFSSLFHKVGWCWWFPKGDDDFHLGRLDYIYTYMYLYVCMCVWDRVLVYGLDLTCLESGYVSVNCLYFYYFIHLLWSIIPILTSHSNSRWGLHYLLFRVHYFLLSTSAWNEGNQILMFMLLLSYFHVDGPQYHLRCKHINA